MKSLLFISLVLAGTIACGSKSDSQTAASTTPTNAEAHHDHHGGDHHGAGAHGDVAADATIVPPGEATVGDTTTCPVSKETFVVSESSPSVEHEGKTYYFCCGGCEGKFAENPGAFLGDDSAS